MRSPQPPVRLKATPPTHPHRLPGTTPLARPQHLGAILLRMDRAGTGSLSIEDLGRIFRMVGQRFPDARALFVERPQVQPAARLPSPPPSDMPHASAHHQGAVPLGCTAPRGCAADPSVTCLCRPRAQDILDLLGIVPAEDGTIRVDSFVDAFRVKADWIAEQQARYTVITL